MYQHLCPESFLEFGEKEVKEVLFLFLVCFTNILLFLSIKAIHQASLVAQWQSICLLMQEAWVQSLGQEDPTCSGATKAMLHNH